MEYTYYGHSCFSVKAGGKILLFDPFISGNEFAKHISIDEIKADYILVSHGHSDHTTDLVRIASNNDAMVIAAYEIAVWAGDRGLKYHPMNIGGKWHFDFGTVKCVTAVHSSMLPDGTYGANAMGFVVSYSDRTFYYAGDTALTLDMQLIPRYKTIDFAIFPVGDNFTMGVEDAIEAANMVKTKKVVGVHFDTFGYIKIDRQKAVDAFEKEGIKLFLPAIGESLNF